MATIPSLDPAPEMAELSMADESAVQSMQASSAVRRMNAAYDWNGPDDPDNPRNFSLRRRTFATVAVTSLAFASAFAGAIYAPAQDEVADLFHCSSEIAVLPLSLYNLGMAFGPIVGAPLSETYGRKCVFAVATPVFTAFMLGGGFATSIVSLSICRFFAGMFAAPNISNASATILDLTANRYRGVSIGIYYSIPSVAASLAPLFGGLVTQAKDWRWTQWMAIIVTVVLYPPILFTKETYKKVVLRRRAIRMGLSDSSSQSISLARAVRHVFTTLIQRPLHMLLTEPIVSLVSLYNGIIYGLLYTFIISVPWIFKHYYDFGPTSQSLSYLGLSLGTIGACVPYAIIDFCFYQKRLGRLEHTHDQSPVPPPENRLAPAMIASFPLPASLLIAGWSAEFGVHWIVPILFQGFAMLSSLLVYAGVSLFMLDTYGPLYGASASSAMMLSRYALSFAFPLFALQMFQALGVGWATTVLALTMLLMAPVPWYFWVFGERIRMKSRYEGSL